jgi:large subunit ribosomal protein L28
VAKCQITGKARMSGNLVSHSNRKTRTVRKANIRRKRIFDPESGQWVRMDISTRALRTLTRKGWDSVKKQAKR